MDHLCGLVPAQEPILALRRQLAVLAGAGADAGRCWLQHARACRLAGHRYLPFSEILLPSPDTGQQALR